MVSSAGVAAVAIHLAKQQAQGWPGSLGIHSRDARHKAKRRQSNAENFGKRLANAAARSQRDQAARGGKKTVKA